MKLQFDKNNNVEDFTIVLSKRNFEHFGEIVNIKRDSITSKNNMNSADEMSFEVYKSTYDEEGKERIERLWDNIVDFKLIWVKELNEYFEITVSLDDNRDVPIKTVVATSLCEAELSQTNLYNVEINTEADIERDDYVITTFYNAENPKGSLLHRILDKMPNYKIKHVDSSLINLQRSFSIDGTSIYDFMIGECSEQFNCLFQFNSTDRSISVYDLYTVCKDCGHREEFDNVCPECGSENLRYYGKDTTIYIDKTNLTESVQLTTDTGSVKNCFKLEAGDDTMTAAIRELNQNGTDYIYYITDEQKADMPGELVEKIEQYDALYNSYTEEYEQVIENIYDTIDEIIYYTHEMMPTIEHAEVTAQTEADKLNQANMGYIALSSVTSSTSKATVESALKNYAKVYVKTGYVKVEINNSDYDFIGEDPSTGLNYGEWVGNFKVTNYSDKEDIAYSPIITVKVDSNYQQFLEQKIKKQIANEDDEDGSIFDVLNISDLNNFKEALKLYCLNRLTSFYDAIQGALDILVQADQASREADLYSILYTPYYDKLKACQAEIDYKQKIIDDLNVTYEGLENRKNEIQDILNFQKYLGEDMYNLFCLYRREDKYSNSNYISDGMENDEILDNAKKFIELAKKELYKSSQHQHSITTTLANLLVMPEFKDILDQFELGNWIRVCVDGIIYRLRLISYEIQFSDIQTLNVEFSTVTKQMDCMSDVQSILQSAQSMSSSYSYVSKQAEKGNEANENYKDLRQDGLDTALIQIKNNNHEEVTYGKHGLLAKAYDDVLDDYSPEQFKLTHNIMAYTDDNWNSVKMALGKISYELDGEKREEYGVNADTLIGGKVISGDIYSLNYSSKEGKENGTHIDLNDGTFSFAGGSLKYDGEKLSLSGEISSSTININDRFKVNAEGKLEATDVTITGGSLNINNKFKVDSNGKLIATDATITGTISGSTITGGNININNKFNVDSNGKLTATNAEITGSITGSTINGTTITGSTLNSVNGGKTTNISGGTISTNNVNISGGSIILNGKNDSTTVTLSSGAIALIRGYSNNDTVSSDRVYTNPLIQVKNSLNYTLTAGAVSIALGSMTSDILVKHYFNVTPIGLVSKVPASFTNLSCSGTKSRLILTKNFNERLLYCYETPTPLFGDIGNGKLDEYGVCYIYIDNIFLETINTNQCQYNVFLTKYDIGDIYVKERHYEYFIVEGTPNLEFSWEIKAKQLGYEMTRLENEEELYLDDKEQLLENDINDWIDNVIMEELNYE